MKHLILAALLAVFSVPALAAPETYILDNNHTLPRFSYNHMGFSRQESRFDKATGKIVVDWQARTGSVAVTIDTTSVNTGSKLFNEHIQGEDYLDTKRFPAATFESSTLKFSGDQLTAVEGMLTLKGISKPVTLAVSSFKCMFNPVLLKNACGANASTLIKRSDYNMGKYAPLVGDEVTVTIPVEAVKE